jgi:CP family cyanate transporter-like MFS transporter
MLGLAWAAYAAFGLVSASLAPLVTPITLDLGISYAQMGMILGAWQLAYIGVAYNAGRILDRFGLRRALGVGILVIAASALARAAAVDFWTMFLAVALFGVGAPMISIGAPKLIATWFEARERGGAAGVYATGPSVGSIVVLTSANAVLLPLTGGWRPTIAVLALGALAIAAVWWLFARDESGRGDRAAAGPAPGLGGLLRVRNVWLVVVIGFASFLSGHALGNWLPKILESRGFDAVSAGYWASIPNVVGIVGALTLPRIVRAEHRVLAVALMFSVNALAIVMIALGSGPLLLGALVMQGFVRNSVTPFLMLVMMESPAVGAAAMGAAGGLFFTVGEIGGFSGPSAMGLILDLTGGFTLGLFALAAVLVVMAIACAGLEPTPAGRRPP